MNSSKHMEIAVYGKGGIGKSTVSANLTAALTQTGLSVLQIGCDPKHDSTRLLMGGEKIPTVLDVLRDKGTDGAEVGDVLRTGAGGAGCIEAGGPKPGVGCAGRGIISAFEFLGKYDLRNRYDRVIYDVLGDVVCGGFAVPVRREYADAVFLVTSGEYMALYAANNILRGIRNFDGDTVKRVAGIIYNERRLEDEDIRVKRFADAVGLPVLAKVPRSDAFARAEEMNTTLFGIEGYPAEKEVFMKLAELIRKGPELYEARPLTDEEHEAVVLGKGPVQAAADKDTGRTGAAVSQGKTAPAPVPPVTRRPLYGCAFNGAASAAVHLNDAVVIAHGPKACAFYTWQNISSPGRRNLFNRGILMPSALSPNFESTDIGHSEAVFGGMEKLREKVSEVLKRRPGAVIVISTCVSGIIGDDLASIEDMSLPDIPVIAVPADGDIAGDYMHGLTMVQETILDRLVIRDIPQREMCVNIIGETAIASNLDYNYAVTEKMLSEMGISVNCRFFGSASVSEVAHLKQAPYSILLSGTSDAAELKKHLEEKYDLRFIDAPLPVGLSATREWIRSVGKAFGAEERAEAVLSSYDDEYQRAVDELREKAAGRRIFLTGINSDMDWIIDTALDAGYSFAYIGVNNYLGAPLEVTRHPERMSMIEEIRSSAQAQERLMKEDPDIILSAYAMQGGSPEAVRDVIPMLPDLGVLSAVNMIRRWQRMSAAGRKGAWENDRRFFEEYYC